MPTRRTTLSRNSSVPVSTTSGVPRTANPADEVAAAAAVRTAAFVPATCGRRFFAKLTLARATKSFQIAAGMSPPATRFIDKLSSLPTQTPTTRSPVKPTNQASR
jgi:hypothetical protein